MIGLNIYNKQIVGIMASKNRITTLKLPKENAEESYKRIHPFLEKYYKEQMMQSNSLEDRHKVVMTLKQLCFSCYLQGLSDAKQVLTK